MDGKDDRREGRFDEAKGDVKEAVGDVTGDRELEHEGKKDRTKGKAMQALGGRARLLHRSEVARSIRRGRHDHGDALGIGGRGPGRSGVPRRGRAAVPELLEEGGSRLAA